MSEPQGSADEVAAGVTSEGDDAHGFWLWHHVLTLMGGDYAELSMNVRAQERRRRQQQQQGQGQEGGSQV